LKFTLLSNVGEVQAMMLKPKTKLRRQSFTWYQLAFSWISLARHRSVKKLPTVCTYVKD